MPEVLIVEGQELLVVDAAGVSELIELAMQGPPGPAGPPGSSVAVSYTTATPISGHMAITLNSDGEAIYADASNPDHRAVVGVTTNAANTGDQVQVITSGTLDHAGWTFTVGSPVFLGVNGALTQTLPMGAVFSKVLGVATTSTRINLDFQPAIFR